MHLTDSLMQSVITAGDTHQLMPFGDDANTVKAIGAYGYGEFAFMVI